MLNKLNSNESYYDGRCAMCTHYQIDDIKSAYNDGFVCDVHWLKRLALDDSCPKYKEDKSRSYKDIKKAFEKMERKYGSYKPHRYYIVTAICDILGIDEYQEYVIMGNLYRDMYLENDESKKGFLQDYYVNGQKIADKLYDDEFGYDKGLDMFNNFIRPFYILVMNKKYDLAFYCYNTMYTHLKEHYGIEDVYVYEKPLQRKRIVDK